jgi:hypothetical protein
MPALKRIVPVAVSLAIIFAVTAVLFCLNDIHGGAQHLIFFYLLPTALVAIIYGVCFQCSVPLWQHCWQPFSSTIQSTAFTWPTRVRLAN